MCVRLLGDLVIVGRVLAKSIDLGAQPVPLHLDHRRVLGHRGVVLGLDPFAIGRGEHGQLLKPANVAALYGHFPHSRLVSLHLAHFPSGRDAGLLPVALLMKSVACSAAAGFVNQPARL